MSSKISFSSVRLSLTLFLCGATVLLLFSYQSADRLDFFSSALSAVFGLIFVLLCFVPSVIIKSRTKLDFISFAKSQTPSGVIFVSAYYALYFVFIATSVLLNYTDMFSASINGESNVYVIAALLLAICVYSAHKGINTVSRTVVFIAAFYILFLILVTASNIPNLDFTVNFVPFNPNSKSFLNNVLFWFSIAFTAVIFGCTSRNAEKFKLRQIVISLAAVVFCAVVFLFFIYFALGAYGNNQTYQVHMLSKASQLGSMKGIDSVYLAAVTAGAFVLISSLLSGMKNLSEDKCSTKILVLFSVVIFILFICSQNYNSVKEILKNLYVLNTLNFISALLIPTIYIFIFRRRLNV